MRDRIKRIPTSTSTQHRSQHGHKLLYIRKNSGTNLMLQKRGNENIQSMRRKCSMGSNSAWINSERKTTELQPCGKTVTPQTQCTVILKHMHQYEQKSLHALLILTLCSYFWVYYHYITRYYMHFVQRASRL